MSKRKYSNLIAFDDAPFDREQSVPVGIIGTIYADLRLDGIITGSVEADGNDATDEIIRLISESKFNSHIQLVLLHGITVAGFNVIDVETLYRRTAAPVLVITRKRPDFRRLKQVLLDIIVDGQQKWSCIEKMANMEPVENIFMQRMGIAEEDAARVIKRLSVHSRIPEPLRVAHLFAAALACGTSHGSA